VPQLIGNFASFPYTLSLKDIETYLSEDADTSHTVLNGRALSPGLCHGRVRIVHDIADAQSDDWPEDIILVADATDPGWTPLFAKARGIVVHRGGSLSHCAIVAREMHKPAVAGISHVTRIMLSFSDGKKNISLVLNHFSKNHNILMFRNIWIKNCLNVFPLGVAI
jgi:phosphoenolpyruvate synthase/pyruvate phosphate dikinase